MGKIFWILSVGAILTLFAFTQKKNHFSAYHNDGIVNVEYSINPPPQRTGAPGENNCTQCHSGSVFSAAGNVNFNFSDPFDEYYPDSTYTIDIGTTGNAINGFEMTILDGNALKAGSFTAGTGTSVLSSGLKEYVRQSGPNAMDWTFQWTAPSSNVGNLTVYYAFNKADNSGSTFGDSIFLGQETIFISSSIGITEYQTLDDSFSAYYDKNNQVIKVSIEPVLDSKGMVQLSDFSGKVLLTQNLGNLKSSEQQFSISTSSVQAKGFYIVSIFLDNYVLNRKIFIE